MSADLNRIIDALDGRREGSSWRCRCPIHNGHSLIVTDKDDTLLVKCHGGCEQRDVLAALKKRRLWPQVDGGRSSTAGRSPGTAEAEYLYKDIDGAVVAVKGRFRKPDGSTKAFAWKRFGADRWDGLKGLKERDLPLYNAAKLATTDGLVLIVEGEKAADACLDAGLLAVCPPGGAAAQEFGDQLRQLAGRDVVLWPDSDDEGRALMQRIGLRLQDTAVSVRTIQPDVPPKGDAYDYFGGGETRDALLALLDRTPRHEPPPPVKLAEALEDVRTFIRRYMVMDDAQADAVALWTAHTHAFEDGETTPYISITSAEKRSGKSRLLETLSLLVARPWLTGRVTAAVLIRKAARDCPTLLLDESDAAFKGEKEYAETLRAVLNAGYRRGGVASLCVKSGGDFDLRDFSVFGPKAIAGIGRLPDTVADRAIPIVLKRKAPGEKAARFKWRRAKEEAAPLRERLERWATATVDALRDAEPVIPDELDDRAAEGWEPLLAIADVAGAEWPQRARNAALVLSVGDAREDDSLGVRLLRDIRTVFQERGVDRLPSAELVEALVAMEEAPWGDLKGKPISARILARLLGRGRYEIKPRVVRVGEATPRGYARQGFEDAWERYLACTPETSATSATSATEQAPRFNLVEEDVADVADVAANTGVHAQDDDNGRRLHVLSLAEVLGWPHVSLGERGVNGRTVRVGVPSGRFVWEQASRYWPDDLLAELVLRLEAMSK